MIVVFGYMVNLHGLLRFWCKNVGLLGEKYANFIIFRQFYCLNIGFSIVNLTIFLVLLQFMRRICKQHLQSCHLEKR
jgi:hypothetical protein